MGTEQDMRNVRIGTPVYDEDGAILGTVRGMDEHGFYVSAEEDIEVLAREATTQGPSTDALMWRCWDCGEMGQLENMPEECPACGAPKEDIYYWQED